MCNGAREAAGAVEDDAVRAGAAARVDAATPEDGELLVRTGDGETEALAVVEGVRVVVAACEEGAEGRRSVCVLSACFGACTRGRL